VLTRNADEELVGQFLRTNEVSTLEDFFASSVILKGYRSHFLPLLVSKTNMELGSLYESLNRIRGLLQTQTDEVAVNRYIYETFGITQTFADRGVPPIRLFDVLASTTAEVIESKNE